MTKKLADVDVAIAWKRLCDKYKPKSAPLHLALKNEFNSKILRSAKSNPNVWLMELQDLRVQLLNAGLTLIEDDRLEHALSNLPKEYEVVVSELEDRLGSKSDPLTIKDLRTQCNLKYQRITNSSSTRGGGGNSYSKDEVETALFAGGFKGKCNQCGQWGHKKDKCPNGSGTSNGNDKSNTSTEKCFYCNKTDHKSTDCFKKKADKGRQQNSANLSTCARESETMVDLFFNVSIGELANAEKPNSEKDYIGDSGASPHMCHSDERMYDWVESDKRIIIPDGKRLRVQKIGKKKLDVLQQDGTVQRIVLTGLKYIPEIYPFNLFSIAQALDTDFELRNSGKVIKLSKGGVVIKFDKLIPTKTGWVGVIERRVVRDVCQFVPRLKRSSNADAAVIQDIFGHAGNEATMQNAEYYGIRINGKFYPCDQCLKAKARQKNVGHGKEKAKVKSWQKDFILTFRRSKMKVLGDQSFGC